MLTFFSRLFPAANIISTEWRALTTAVNTQIRERGDNFRCAESNPSNHSADHIAQFYSLPKNDVQTLFTHGGLPKLFKEQCKTFNETCIMIRKPAIDVINSLKIIDYNKPAYRFVLYGVMGSGRSLSLAHIIHYGHKNGFLLVHVPWVGNWMRRCRETSNAVMEEGLIDINIDAAMWLTHFKTQNEELLKDEQFKVSQDYIWNKREKTAQNASLLELIDFGINRIKYASSCIVVLAEEIKKLSKSGVCKTLVAIDGYNAFFHPKTRIFKENKEIVHPHKVTVTKAFLSLTNFDWNNAGIVVTVDALAMGEPNPKSFLPKFLLGKEGFEHLDPFIPVEVENYSEKEFISCIDYYNDRKWIQQYYPELRNELSFVSNNNPFKLQEITGPL
ncbi:28S ribosomal protein S29, mitochondrial [Coccinella septempunctata]|uniref:28S ribosomal protein S29, mitochondrial n=1 Tax=Coccinella septempunctata TaxID=41139 RepID=UPI001D07A974|nr:28S ribosomal protein S29, mitochondrial [Coccinella septempunctata]